MPPDWKAPTSCCSLRVWWARWWDCCSERAAAETTDRRFRASIAGALGITIAGAAGGPESASIVLGGVAPALCLLYHIIRFNVLGLFISRRIVFAAVLGGVSAIYLLLARGGIRLGASRNLKSSVRSSK